MRANSAKNALDIEVKLALHDLLFRNHAVALIQVRHGKRALLIGKSHQRGTGFLQSQPEPHRFMVVDKVEIPAAYVLLPTRGYACGALHGAVLAFHVLGRRNQFGEFSPGPLGTLDGLRG
ncbi:MAG: hypothetical protein JNK21_10815 [Rhodospirillaceae bacterium]|nr:hypothetical protein [Rhodospirillaceae bacterium]